MAIPYAPSQSYIPDSSIIQLIQQAGRDAANGQRASGQIWGNVLGNLGQIASGTIRDIAENKRQAPIDAQNAQLRQQAIARGQNQLDAEQEKSRLNDVMSNQQQMTAQGQDMTPESIASNLSANGLGQYVPEVLKAHQETRAALAAQRESTAFTIANFADHAAKFVGTPVFDGVLAQSAKDLQGIVPGVDQTIAEIRQLPPDQQRLKLESLATMSPTYNDRKAKAAKENTVVAPETSNIYTIGPDGKPVLSVAATPKPKEQIFVQRGGKVIPIDKGSALPGDVPYEPGQAETARHNRVSEANAALANGSVFMPGSGPSIPGAPGAAPSGPPGSPPQQLTGDAYLNTLPPQIANEVKAYAEGRRPFPTGMAMKSPYFQNLIRAASQYDPEYDAVNYGGRAATRKDFTSGKSAQTVNALNTAIGHMNELSSKIDALDNFDTGILNTGKNAIKTALGSPQQNNFEVVKKGVVDELTRVWRQTGGSDADIKAKESVLKSSSSPAILNGAVGEFASMLESKLQSLETQKDQGLGRFGKDITVITPASRAILNKLITRAGGTTSAPAASGGKWVQQPDGTWARQ